MKSAPLAHRSERKSYKLAVGCSTPPRSTSEREIQVAAVKALRKLGSTVFVTSTNRKSRCTRGTPDIFASLPGRMPAMYVGIEIKSTKGKLTDDQKWEERLGAVIICRSVEDAMRAAGYSVE